MNEKITNVIEDQNIHLNANEIKKLKEMADYVRNYEKQVADQTVSDVKNEFSNPIPLGNGEYFDINQKIQHLKQTISYEEFVRGSENGFISTTLLERCFSVFGGKEKVRKTEIGALIQLYVLLQGKDIGFFDNDPGKITFTRLLESIYEEKRSKKQNNKVSDVRENLNTQAEERNEAAEKAKDFQTRIEGIEMLTQKDGYEKAKIRLENFCREYLGSKNPKKVGEFTTKVLEFFEKHRKKHDYKAFNALISAYSFLFKNEDEKYGFKIVYSRIVENMLPFYEFAVKFSDNQQIVALKEQFLNFDICKKDTREFINTIIPLVKELDRLTGGIPFYDVKSV